MLVTPDGIFILVKDEHSRNALLPMPVTPDGISMVVNDVQPENAC